VFSPSPRLDPRALDASCWDEIRRIHTNPQTMATLGGVRTEEMSRAWMAWNVEHWEQRGYGMGLWHHRDSRELAGLGGLRHLDVDGVDEVEVGYALLPPYWGQGLATEIARHCIRYGFDVLRLPTIMAITTPQNAGSRHVMEKAGMVFERDWLHKGTPTVLYRMMKPLAP
jgi:ribosomal-protein-alanine N-acetyltransferase